MLTVSSSRRGCNTSCRQLRRRASRGLSRAISWCTGWCMIRSTRDKGLRSCSRSYVASWTLVLQQQQPCGACSREARCPSRLRVLARCPRRLRVHGLHSRSGRQRAIGNFYKEGVNEFVFGFLLCSTPFACLRPTYTPRGFGEHAKGVGEKLENRHTTHKL